MSKALGFAITVGVTILGLTMGKAYAQSTYPVASEIIIATPVPIIDISISNPNQKVSIWTRH